MSRVLYDYDGQIARLKADPKVIDEEWINATGLFELVSINSHKIPLEERLQCGCLTMIRKDPELYVAYVNDEIDMELTKQIAEDTRLPNRSGNIKLEHLPVFKEWWDKLNSYARD